jgi:hypothetical protein
MLQAERTAAQWFEEATHFYQDGHQGCAWCGGHNLVYRSERQGLVEYHCGGCDFFVAEEVATGRHFVTPGRKRRGHAAPATMLDIDWEDVEAGRAPEPALIRTAGPG